MKARGRFWRIIRWILLVIGILILGAAAILFIPPTANSYPSHPDPSDSYSQSQSRIQTILGTEDQRFNPSCRVQFLTHEKMTEHVIILVHGYGNCPHQFLALGEQFYQLGYNVLIAPLPHHGFADMMSTDQEYLTADELAAYGDQVVDIAQGLGEQVSIMGLSAGGVVTSWAAQHRDDLNLAVVISPGFGYQVIPTPLTVPVMRIFMLRPNYFEWWNSELKEAGASPYGYAQYSSHALAQILSLGAGVKSAACRSAPQAAQIIAVTNANDDTINNELFHQVADCWQAHGANLSTYEFSADLKLPHDLVDVDQEGERTDVVYPILVDLVTGTKAP